MHSKITEHVGEERILETDGQADRQMNMWTVCSSSEPRLKIAVGVPLASLQHIVTSLEPSRVLLELLSTLLSESLGGTSRAKPLVRLKPAELGACRC